MDEITKAIEKLIKAIERSNVRNWGDYLLIIVPIVLSVVAIAVSICSVKKQNKIALFEKRFDVYTWMQKCMSFGRLLENVDSQNKLYDVFCMSFGVEHSVWLQDHGWAESEFLKIEEKLMQAPHLFRNVNENRVKDVCVALLALLLDIENIRPYEEDVEKYSSKVFYFYEIFESVNKSLNLQ